MKKSIFRIVSISLAAALIFSCAACSGDTTSSSSSAASSAAVVSGSGSTTDVKPILFESDVWTQVPMISKELVDAGYAGGEACQMILGLTFDSIDGKLGFFGTDVAGLYRTTDGGTTWELNCLGFVATGATGFAIDPMNKDRVLCIGANSAAQDVNGIHQSVDGGDSWNYVFKATTYGFRDQRSQIAYDKSSYDSSLGYCKVVYWSREDDATAKGAENDPGLYKSEDGGTTWTRLDNSSLYGGADIFVNPSNGNVYVANKNGVFVSKDGGKSFNKSLDIPANSMNCVITAPDSLYVTTDSGFYVSENGGDSFDKIVAVGYPSASATHLKVSPVNRNNMVLQKDTGRSDNVRKYYFSKDGGNTWSESKRDLAGHFMPSGTLCATFAWSPVDENKVFTNWKHIVCSTDGGANYKWSNAGFSAICASGSIRFNINNPDLIAISSQDYNGGISTDGGKTWRYVNWSGKSWGGYTYGAYCLDENNAWVGLADGWTKPRYLAVTHDGGRTITQTDIHIKGKEIGYGVPGDDNIGFIGEWRTTDKGNTWSDMTGAGDGCIGVFTHDPDTGRLWGYSSQFFVVYSDDKGETWVNYNLAADGVTDMAYDKTNKKLYIASGGVIQVSDTTGAEYKDRAFKPVNVGGSGFKSVALDPIDSNIIYASNSSLTKSCFRSLDGGKTWTCLTRYKGDGRDGEPYGVRCVGSMIVNPKTRELFCFTGCYGVWKIAPPPAN